MTFFAQDFLKAQYFSQRYMHGPQEETSGRSGYWRLFFYKMQEEALKSEEQIPEITEQHSEQPKPAKVAKVAKKIRKPYEVKEEIPEPIKLPPFKRKPVYTQPSAHEKLLALQPLPAPVRIRHNREDNVIQLNIEKIKRKQRARRRAAAFLLLAA